MHDPKFEQEVQRKMHDLEFVPSDSVWEGIQQGIGPRERRRAVAILWWLFPGMFLIAGGVVLYRHSASTSIVKVATPVRSGVDAGGRVGAGVSGDRLAGGSASRAVDGSVSRSADGSVDRSAGGSGDRLAGDAASGKDGMAADGAGSANRGPVSRYHPGLIGGMGLLAGVKAPGLYPRPVNPVISGIRQPRHPWSVGFAFGGGGSSIYSESGNALGVSTSNNNIYALAMSRYGTNAAQPPGPRTSAFTATANGAKRSSTGVKVGYSYWAGVVGEKPLSARLSVDIGLNLHYYSVRLQTESQVSTYAPTAASLFVPSAVTYTSSSPGVSSSNGEQTYVNSYYFLEVPVMVRWRLNHSPSLPLFWRGGAELSYLISSNGLYYDANSGFYKSDNGVVRRTQVGVNSGLTVGLPVKGVQIEAGPEIQYALSGLLKTGSGGGHMLYGGMRVAVMR